MKVIISRKGFDSSNGGCPSPIFPNGEILSLPIPSRRAATRYADLALAGRNGGEIVEALTAGRICRNATAHVDPDLDARCLPRRPRWRPAFGQTGRQLSHLTNRGVTEGDLFLFFGWFNDVVETPDGALRRVPGAPNRHVIFGWLQVGSIIAVGAQPGTAVAANPWLQAHPHVMGTWGLKNSIFVASDALNMPGLPRFQSLSGGGTFAKITAARTLSKAGQPLRSLWSLPSWLSPVHGKATLSLHEKTSCWSHVPDSENVLLDSAKIGQEFVLESRDAALLSSWLNKVFE